MAQDSCLSTGMTALQILGFDVAWGYLTLPGQNCLVFMQCRYAVSSCGYKWCKAPTYWFLAQMWYQQPPVFGVHPSPDTSQPTSNLTPFSTCLAPSRDHTCGKVRIWGTKIFLGFDIPWGHFDLAWSKLWHANCVFDQNLGCSRVILTPP